MLKCRLAAQLLLLCCSEQLLGDGAQFDSGSEKLLSAEAQIVYIADASCLVMEPLSSNILQYIL